MKSKTVNLVLGLATIAVLGMSVFLWSSGQKAEAKKQETVDAIANLRVINQGLDQN